MSDQNVAPSRELSPLQSLIADLANLELAADDACHAPASEYTIGFFRGEAFAYRKAGELLKAVQTQETLGQRNDGASLLIDQPSSPNGDPQRRDDP